MLAQLSGQVRGSLEVRDSRGQALVEAALTLLLLCVFIFAIFEGGRLIQVQQTLTDAAREGARRSVAPMTQTLEGGLPSQAEVKAFVRSYLEAASVHVPIDNIAVDQSYSDGVRTYTQVTVTYPYRVMTLSMFRVLNMTLTGKSRMRNETSDK